MSEAIITVCRLRPPQLSATIPDCLNIAAAAVLNRLSGEGGRLMNEGNEALVGAWRLVSAVMQDIETNEKIPVWGDDPNGCLVLTSAGRWIVIQTAQGRKAPQTEQDRASAFKSMLAYAGRFRTRGDQIVIGVDIAWDESWNGTEQVRSYRIENEHLHIEAAPQRYPAFGGKLMRGILIWKRY